MVDTIEDQIRNFIIEQFPSARRLKLTDTDALLEKGIIDSLGVLDVVSFVETAFAISVADEELLPENFQTIERLAAFVASKRNGK